MEDFKKFSLLKDVQTITSDGTPSMDKQDKTAEDGNIEFYKGPILSIQKYVSELEAKIKALEERLEAADEVIQASRSIKLYATHGLIAEDYNKALEKYNSLKQ